jgi:hypothetical protein
MFFQWVLCASIWVVGVAVQFSVGETQFEPISVIGGVSWATGNLCVVPVVQAIGLAQGLLLWGTSNMIMGWAAARFGFFGIVPQTPDHVLYQVWPCAGPGLPSHLRPTAWLGSADGVLVLQDLGVICAALR